MKHGNTLPLKKVLQQIPKLGLLMSMNYFLNKSVQPLYMWKLDCVHLVNLITKIINKQYLLGCKVQLCFHKKRNELTQVVTNSFIIHFSKWEKAPYFKNSCLFKIENQQNPLNTKMNMNSLVLLVNISFRLTAV